MFEYDGRPPVGRLGGALDRLAGEELAGLPVAALGEDVLALGVARNRLEAEFARRLVAFDRGGGAAAAGAASTAAWLRHRARLAPGPAAAWVRTARRLADDLTASAAALAAGAVSVRHVEVIAAATADLPAEAVAGGEAILLGAARELDPQRLRHAAVHLRNVVAPERVRADAAAAHAARYLTLAETFGGTVALQGQLDPEAGATVLAAVLPLASPAGPADDRTPAQRRADALVELARRSLDGGGLPESGGERPHLNVTVDLSALLGAPGTRAAELDWAAPVPVEVARRLGCDAAVARIVFAGPSDVLDVGRRSRVVSPGLRRALAARDRGCVFVGCDRAPAHCDGHHITSWLDGGPTDVDNLVLLCRVHHRLVHDGGWRLRRDDDGVVTVTPPASVGARAPNGQVA